MKRGYRNVISPSFYSPSFVKKLRYSALRYLSIQLLSWMGRHLSGITGLKSNPLFFILRQKLPVPFHSIK